MYYCKGQQRLEAGGLSLLLKGCGFVSTYKALVSRLAVNIEKM